MPFYEVHKIGKFRKIFIIIRIIMDLHKVSISTPRLVLSAFMAKDADETYNCITPTLTRYMAWDPQPRHEFNETWNNWLKNFTLGLEIIFAIREINTHQFIGLVGIHHLQTSIPEVGIWIREDCHQQRYGQEAVSNAVQWATENIQADYLVYPVAKENIPSRKIAESLGGEVVSSSKSRKYELVTYKIPLKH
jgi:RimJ/RimL family protein N-acetyltransferase